MEIIQLTKMNLHQLIPFNYLLITPPSIILTRGRPSPAVRTHWKTSPSSFDTSFSDPLVHRHPEHFPLNLQVYITYHVISSSLEQMDILYMNVFIWY